MKKILTIGLAMVMFIAVPCLSFDGFQGHEGQIPFCQNKKTGKLKIVPMKDIDPTGNLNYEPNCNANTETLIWISQGPPSGLYALFEPMTNVPEATFTSQGWTACYSDLYNNAGTPLSTILSACNKSNLMLACRPVGSATFTVAAFANRNDILTDTGAADNNVTHIANGAGWYYNADYSWGFAKAGDSVDKLECDFLPPDNLDKRLCWHTLGGGGSISGGYRCGATVDLNDSTDWERIILHHD
jgi:hypothetical protein